MFELCLQCLRMHTTRYMRASFGKGRRQWKGGGEGGERLGTLCTIKLHSCKRPSTTHASAARECSGHVVLCSCVCTLSVHSRLSFVIELSSFNLCPYFFTWVVQGEGKNKTRKKRHPCHVEGMLVFLLAQKAAVLLDVACIYLHVAVVVALTFSS